MQHIADHLWMASSCKFAAESVVRENVENQLALGEVM